jgi:hypothetical protein
MCYNKKCSEKMALSGHVIQLSIKTLTSKFGKWINPIAVLTCSFTVLHCCSYFVMYCVSHFSSCTVEHCCSYWVSVTVEHCCSFTVLHCCSWKKKENDHVSEIIKKRFCPANAQPSRLEICSNPHIYEGTQFLYCSILSWISCLVVLFFGFIPVLLKLRDPVKALNVFNAETRWYAD